MTQKISPFALLFISSLLTHATAQALPYQDSPFGFSGGRVVGFDLPESPMKERLRKLNALFDDLGVHFSRDDPLNYIFAWQNVEARKGNLDFSWLDIFVDSSETVTSIAVIHPFVDWDQKACPANTEEKCASRMCNQDCLNEGKTEEECCEKNVQWKCMPCDLGAYRNFLAKTVERYKGRIKYWEILNEPDLGPPAGWQGKFTPPFWRSSEEDYVELLKASYETIHEVCDDCQVLVSGLAGLDSDVTKQIMELGAENFFDIFNFHYYGSYSGLKSILENAPYKIKKEIWLTETASIKQAKAYLRNEISKDTYLQKQAEHVVKMYVTALSLGIKKVFWQQLSYEREDDKTGWELVALTHIDGKTRRPAYYTYKKMTELLEGADWKNIQTIQESGDVYVYRFTRNGTPVYVAWWDYFNDPTYTPGKTMPVTITGLTGNAALATEAVPPFASGAEVTDYNTAFRQQSLPVTGGTVTLQLGESPVFVEGPAVSLRVNGNPNATVTVSNPVTVDYTIRGGQGQEFFLALDAPAMGIPWAYRTAAGTWIPLPVNLSDVIPFATAPADGDHTLYTGTVPAGAYSLCLGYDTIPNGHLNLEAAVYDCVEATVR